MIRKLYIAFGLTLLMSLPPSILVATAGAQTAKAVGTALNSCRNLTASGSYYLTQNVSSPGTCFGIDANNVSLNLNGHTITYGTNGGSSPTPAIEAHDCWWTGTPEYQGGYCGSAHSGVEVYGGSIVQSRNSAPFSDVFSFGQGTFKSAPYIHNITATFQNQGAQFYYSAYMPGGTRIVHNTIYDNVKNINRPGQSDQGARSLFQGQAIEITGQWNNHTKTGDYIAYNKIVGSPQGGILTVDQYSQIYGNDIAQNATYANDFCVEIDADHTTAEYNYCHPKSGRGINVNASYVTITKNHITTTELPQDPEYGGCELGGSYGVRVEAMPVAGIHPNPVDVVISNNLFVTNAGACDARAMRFIYLTNQARVSVTGNTVLTTSRNQAGQDFGISLDDTSAAGITITGNTITSHTAWAETDWDGGNNLVIGHNTWNGRPQYTYWAGDGGCDPSSSEREAACPVNVTLTDSLPNAVRCSPYSEARVDIGGKVTQCHGH